MLTGFVVFFSIFHELNVFACMRGPDFCVLPSLFQVHNLAAICLLLQEATYVLQCLRWFFLFSTFHELRAFPSMLVDLTLCFSFLNLFQTFNLASYLA
jgi:hypothetical protein